ncbi:MAG TPA: hypothetical protein VNW92_25740 [Polyangiaceae bacterium]|jgi:hypothetical protein|nr:hypothetical protein [Polyangiaceae bacterium]
MNAGADAGPGSVGVAGQDSSGGASAGAGPEASGGAGTDAGEQLTFCPRLGTPALAAFNVTRDYDHAVYADCRVSWVTNLYLAPVPSERDTFLNNLLSWSMRLWGCLTPPVDDFELIYTKAPLTSADATALIDDYMVAATADLKLSTQESHDMRAALVRLSQQMIAQDSTDFSHSTCDGTGGTGGTGGTTGGTGGSSGTGGTGGGTGGTGSGSGGQAALAGAADVSAGAGGSNP